MAEQWVSTWLGNQKDVRLNMNKTSVVRFALVPWLYWHQPPSVTQNCYLLHPARVM
uniref:Uncharacterized protein n=1 Tax=Anguilla anguilla TaxID=7936 RepID=A0A0E9SZX3_ANGAN